MLVNLSGKYSIGDIYNMIPWEFQIYVKNYSEYIEEKNRQQNG